MKKSYYYPSYTNQDLPHRKKVEVDGQIFDSVSDAAYYLRITSSYMSIILNKKGGVYRDHQAKFVIQELEQTQQ